MSAPIDMTPRERGALAALAGHDSSWRNPFDIGRDGYYRSTEYDEWAAGFARVEDLLARIPATEEAS